MPEKSGTVIKVLFRAAGKDPAILSLNDHLEGKLESEPVKVGDMRYGKKIEQAFISLEIIGETEDKNEAVRKLMDWLNKHAECLKTVKAEKWIEVCTGLLPNQAYEQFSFTVDLMKVAIKADCHLDNTCYALITPRDSMHQKWVG